MAVECSTIPVSMFNNKSSNFNTVRINSSSYNNNITAFRSYKIN
uniref:Uncharacterized protein n=1 Tax=Rhizophora mucronata TaxID=61149 RepID=A0A2P2Q9T2_RHIMU